MKNKNKTQTKQNKLLAKSIRGEGSKSLKSLKKALWKLVSEFVRRDGADWRGYNRCFTCGVKKNYKELQCGHFIHGKLDFDLRNLKPQCVRCNKWLRGALGVYGVKLVQNYGLEWVEQLQQDAARKGNNYSRQEVLDLTLWFKDKLKKMQKNE